MSRKQTPISTQYQLSGQVLEEVKVYHNSSNSTRTELTFQLIGKLEYAEKKRMFVCTAPLSGEARCYTACVRLYF